MQTRSRTSPDTEYNDENGSILCEVSQNGVSAGSPTGDKVAALKERNRDKIATKKLTKFDEEIVRLIGQHLDKLGLKYV